MRVNWRISVAYLLGLFAAGILAIAAFYKAGDPGLFADQITAHRVTPESWSLPLAYFFVGLELVTAAAFVAFIWPRVVFAGTILLMLGFIGVTAWAWAHGNAEGCGCFGRLVDRGPREVIIEDALVVLTSAVAFLLLRGFRMRPWQWAVGVPLVAVALLLTVFGTVLPLDEAVVGIRPGTDLSDMALDGSRIPVDEGWLLLAIVGPECPACDEGIDSLKEVATNEAGPLVLAAFPGTRGEAQSWRMKRLPNFPVATSARLALRQYYRRLPTVFLLEDGIVRRAWWGRIPTAAEAIEARAASGI